MLSWLIACGASEPIALSERPAHVVAPSVPVEESCAPTTAGLPPDERLAGAGVVVVHKGRRLAGLYDGGALQACWRVALGGGADAGPKEREGDQRTPEGWYRTSDRPQSQFYHAITLYYPNLADADRGLAAGTIDGATREAIADAEHHREMPPQDTALGSHLLLHGGGSGSDWTLGCVALDDADIDALRGRLPAGMRTWVLILP